MRSGLRETHFEDVEADVASWVSDVRMVARGFESNEGWLSFRGIEYVKALADFDERR